MQKTSPTLCCFSGGRSENSQNTTHSNTQVIYNIYIEQNKADMKEIYLWFMKCAVWMSFPNILYLENYSKSRMQCCQIGWLGYFWSHRAGGNGVGLVIFVNIWWDLENIVKTNYQTSQKHHTNFSKLCVHSLLLLNLREVFFPSSHNIIKSDWNDGQNYEIKQHVIT